MRRTILILLLFIIGNGLLLLGIDFKPTIPIIILQIMSFWGTYKLIKEVHPTFRVIRQSCSA